LKGVISSLINTPDKSSSAHSNPGLSKSFTRFSQARRKMAQKANDFEPATRGAGVWKYLELFGATLKTFGVYAEMMRAGLSDESDATARN
jgi:hypothetical protein